MKKTLLKNNFLIFMSLFFLTCCATVPTYQQLSSEEKVAKIKIGDSQDKVITLWGQKAEVSSEHYDLTNIRLLNYTAADGRPEAFFSIDPVSNKVIGKALWVYSNHLKPKVENSLEERFKNIQWQTYTPCHTRSDKDKILVNRDQCLTLDIGGNGISLISWSTPDFISLRIELIMKTCPKLQ